MVYVAGYVKFRATLIGHDLSMLDQSIMVSQSNQQEDYD